MGNMTVNIQGVATELHPVLYHIFYIVQYLLDIKAKFMNPVNCRSHDEIHGTLKYPARHWL